jgi:3-deoxy-D-manno-octulosonic acid kinase
MRALDLPVPSPVAARCCKRGLFYRADLVTRRINDVVTLADCLLGQACDDSVWHTVGSCIRRFHDAEVYHADLNARNILLNTMNEKVYLVDFDKGGIRYLGESWKAANLARLQRSLLKFKSLNTVFYYDHANWRALLAGYNKQQQ